MKEELARPTITREYILCYIDQFRKLNTNRLEHRRKLIDSFVNAIFLYDDKMVITFNYKEQTKTITFADLEKSGIGSDINAHAAPRPRVSVTLGFFIKNPYISTDLLLKTQKSLIRKGVGALNIKNQSREYFWAKSHFPLGNFYLLNN